jgi:hypothetical protein
MSARSEAGNGRQAGEEDGTRRFIESGLEVLGLEAGPDEIAVIQAVDAIYGPSLEALMAEGFDGIPHEPGADMAKPPRTDSER